MYTKILEVNLFAFAYRLFHRDFSTINGTYCNGTYSRIHMNCIIYIYIGAPAFSIISQNAFFFSYRRMWQKARVYGSFTSSNLNHFCSYRSIIDRHTNMFVLLCNLDSVSCFIVIERKG